MKIFMSAFSERETQRRPINMAKKISVVPSVLSFTRHIEPGDGFMYRTTWENRLGNILPIEVLEKTIRTVMSNRPKDATADKNGKPLKQQKAEDWQIHRIDYSTLGADCDTLVVKFTLKFLGGIKPDTCNDIDFARSLNEKIKAYMDASDYSHGIGDLGLRYARNLAAASFLWRNRVGAETIETEITDITRGKRDKMVFDSLSISSDFYEAVDPSSDLGKLGALIAGVLKSDSDHLLLEIVSRVKIAYGQEVYPSQDMIEGGDKNDKARKLHSVDGIASLTSQKLGNAIRRIDTWYDEYEDFEIPLSVEAYGTYTSLGKVFRDVGGNCFYKLFDKWAGGEDLSPEAMDYVIAMLIRGGVFSQKAEKGE